MSESKLMEIMSVRSSPVRGLLLQLMGEECCVAFMVASHASFMLTCYTPPCVRPPGVDRASWEHNMDSCLLCMPAPGFSRRNTHATEDCFKIGLSVRGFFHRRGVRAFRAQLKGKQSTTRQGQIALEDEMLEQKREEMRSHHDLSADKNDNVEEIDTRWSNLLTPEEVPVVTEILLAILAERPATADDLELCLLAQRRIHKMQPKKSQLLHMYNILRNENRLPADAVRLDELLTKKAGKSSSGVLVITVLTSPYPKVGEKVQEFSCKWNCFYCPNEPGQPRSYLHDEPSVIRANRNSFDPVLQFHDRAATLAINGHPVDKIECLVLGGTWSSYPHEYQETFCRDLFYAANTFHSRDGPRRPPLPIAEEQKLNEVATCKIIGITLETRPDCINAEELRRFRRYGCTRVQIGIQHTDDAVLKKVNRGCTTRDTIQAIRMLLNCCFKVDGHFMPDLPGSSFEKDMAMFKYIVESEDIRVDQMKIYPHAVVPWTVTKKWLESGEYVPYTTQQLVNLLVAFKETVPPWVRLNRVIRDIPSHYVANEGYSPNLRQCILDKMKAKGTSCKCIRCREVKLLRSDCPTELVVREYKAAGGKEFFLSIETPDYKTIFGFARLRLSEQAGEGEVFPELRHTALIRELHVYGKLVTTTDRDKSQRQHVGFGRQLMKKAESIAKQHGFGRVAVISGVGARAYYQNKLGYQYLDTEGGFMVKDIRDREYYLYWLTRQRFPWPALLAACVAVLLYLFFLP